jgi:hypothetical protein
MKTQQKSSAPSVHDQYAMQIAREVSRSVNPNSAYVTATKQVSVPLHLSTLAAVEVLARRSGVSRGAMVAQLTKVGASLVLDQLDPEAVAEVGEQVGEREQELYDEFDPEEA